MTFWNEIYNEAIDITKIKISEKIKQLLNDKAIQRKLKALIENINNYLLDKYGNESYYELLDRYIQNGKISDYMCDHINVSAFYYTLICAFFDCDDQYLGRERFANKHLDKIQKSYPNTNYDKSNIKKFFLYCYDVFEMEFSIPTDDNKTVVNKIKGTIIDEVFAVKRDLMDESIRTQNTIENGFKEMHESFKEMHSQYNEKIKHTYSDQEILRYEIHNDNSEYQKIYQDSLFLEKELEDYKKATLQNTYIRPFIKSDSFINFDLEKWVQDRDSRVLLLYGKAGVGKTSFVSWLVFEHYFNVKCHILELRKYTKILNSTNPWKSIKMCYQCENDNLYENTVLILDGLDEVCVLNGEFNGNEFMENLKRTLRSGFGRNIRVIITSRMGYFSEIKRDMHTELATIYWNENSVNKWCDSYCCIHENRIEWCACFNEIYENLSPDDKRREVFCSPLILYICCVSQIDISKHNSVASIYDEAFRVIGEKQYHIWNEKTEKESEINKQFTKELAFQMFLNDKLEDVLDSDLVEIAKEKTAQLMLKKYSYECIKPEFKKIYALNHFAFGSSDAVEFAHKTVGEYFTAVKLYEDYFKCVFDNTLVEAWRHMFNAFRYKKIPVDIMNYLVDLIGSKQKNNWKSNFFKIYYDGIEQQLLVTVASEKSEYLTIHASLLNQIQLVFRNLTWLLTSLGFNNKEFNNTKRNLEILSSYIDGDVNFRDWKNLEGIDLSFKNLKEAIFSGGYLNYAIFNNSFLNRTIFNGACLRFSSFLYASIEMAKFEETHLENANFYSACLFESVFKKAHLEKTSFLRADLRNANLQKTYFYNAKLEEAHLENAQLEEAHFEKAHLEGAHLEYAHLELSHFEEACLNKTYLEGVHLYMTHFEGANLENVCFGREGFNQIRFKEMTPEMIEFNKKNMLMLINLYLLESDLPKYDEYIQKKYIAMISPFVQTDDHRKTYNPEANRMEILDNSSREYF